MILNTYFYYLKCLILAYFYGLTTHHHQIVN